MLKNRDIQNNTVAYSYFINKYVKENKCKFLSPTIEKQLLDELNKANQLKTLDTAVNMILKDTSGMDQSLFDFAKKNNYTLITFFDPTCEHCKIELPKMDSVIRLIEDQLVISIGKYTICNDPVLQKEIWTSFILEHRLDKNYIHVHLAGHNDYRNVYDAFSNPLFYLIDNEGKFVGKKISVNTLRKLIVANIQSGK